jgi:hypothetical protein
MVQCIFEQLIVTQSLKKIPVLENMNIQVCSHTTVPYPELVEYI